MQRNIRTHRNGFLSTPSARRATIDQQAEIDSYLISIHALREEGDMCSATFALIAMDFYPRPPRGGRHQRTSFPAESGNFYPRPPRGGRHLGIYQEKKAEPISIHALREEGDVLCSSPAVKRWIFLSTPSARRATYVISGLSRLFFYFYPRPPRGGRPCAQALS